MSKLTGQSEKIDCAIVDPSNFTPPYNQALCEAVSNLGHEITWLGRVGRDDDPIDSNGHLPQPFFYKFSEKIRQTAPNSITLLVKAVEHLFDMNRLPGEVVRRDLDIVHFQWTPIPLIDNRVIQRIRRNVPVVLTVHDTAIFHGNASHSAQRFAWRDVLCGVDRVIVHVRSAISQLTEIGVERKRISLIPHPVFPKPPEEIVNKALSAFSLSALGFTEQTTNLLLFGRLAPYKGLDTLLAALEMIPNDTKRGIRVVLAGRAAFDVVEFRRKIEAANLSDTLVVNSKFIPDNELIAYLARCDVALFPYLDIDASGALMQALPYGPAIIASRLGVFEEILDHEKTALLVPPFDSGALADAIVRLVSDRDLQKSIRNEVALVAGEELSWSVAAKATVDVYRQAIAERKQ